MFKKFKIDRNLLNPLLFIFIFGLVLRLIFIWQGADIYYGSEAKHINGDTYSFTSSFENLFLNGNYSFDPSIPDASFGRLPGYPFFYGIHYIIFGKEYAFIATSITQAILDSSIIIFIYIIILRFSQNAITALIGALLYATYPFIIVWTSVIGSEILANFLVFLYFFVLVTKSRSGFYYFILGIVVCCAFYTREYLGILVPITLLYFFIINFKLGIKEIIKSVILFNLAFLLLYLPWPVRNYLNHDQVVLIKPTNAGYPNLTSDALSYHKFVDSWSVDNLMWYEEMKHDNEINFPSNVFATEEDKFFADSIVALSRSCGSGFYYRKYNKKWESEYNCNDEISAGFLYLRDRYKSNYPVKYWLVVPLKKMKKAIFKTKLSSTSESGTVSLFIAFLFSYRSILILIGIIGLFIFRNNRPLLIIALYTLFIYVFICFIFRSIEIRYFLQADTLLLLPGAMLIGSFLNKILPHKLSINPNKNGVQETLL